MIHLLSAGSDLLILEVPSVRLITRAPWADRIESTCALTDDVTHTWCYCLWYCEHLCIISVIGTACNLSCKLEVLPLIISHRYVCCPSIH